MRYVKLCILEILFVDLVSDDILQMALGSELLKKFGGGMLHNIDQRHLLHLQTTGSCAIIHKENCLEFPLERERGMFQLDLHWQKHTNHSCWNSWQLWRSSCRGKCCISVGWAAWRTTRTTTTFQDSNWYICISKVHHCYLIQNLRYKCFWPSGLSLKTGSSIVES